MTEQIKIEIIDLGRRRNEDVRKQFLTEMKIYILQKELFSFVPNEDCIFIHAI